MSKQPSFLVCGTTPMSNTSKGKCTKCDQTIWPTSGSLKMAEEKGWNMLCLDCAMKIPIFDFNGMMEDGEYLPKEQSQKLFELLWSELYSAKGNSWNGIQQYKN